MKSFFEFRRGERAGMGRGVLANPFAAGAGHLLYPAQAARPPLMLN
jgi:hypothetical protein